VEAAFATAGHGIHTRLDIREAGVDSYSVPEHVFNSVHVSDTVVLVVKKYSLRHNALLLLSSVHVTDSAFSTVVHVVHTSAAAAPSFQYPTSHADTRLVVAVVHVYVASGAVFATAGHGIHTRLDIREAGVDSYSVVAHVVNAVHVSDTNVAVLSVKKYSALHVARLFESSIHVTEAAFVMGVHCTTMLPSTGGVLATTGTFPT